jgi:hypothetical protein
MKYLYNFQRICLIPILSYWVYAIWTRSGVIQTTQTIYFVAVPNSAFHEVCRLSENPSCQYVVW